MKTTGELMAKVLITLKFYFVRYLMRNTAPLSSRRRINIKTVNFESTINNFLKEAIKFESPPDPPTSEQNLENKKPKVTRRTLNNGSTPKTSDEMRAGRRRAFEKAHQIQVEKALKNSDKQWEEQKRYRDWKTKKAFKSIEPRRYSEDKHVLEDIVHERNAYYLESIGSNEQGTQNRISNLRTLPRDIRSNSHAAKQTFMWS